MKDFLKTLLWFSALLGISPLRLASAVLSAVLLIALLTWALVLTA